MKNKITNPYIMANILILILGVCAFVFINYIKTSKEKEYFNEKISNLNISYSSSIDKYRVLTKYVLEQTIKNDLTLSLFERGVNSKDDVRRLYKGLLYQNLEPVYENLKKEGIVQLQFILEDNKSYLRFHNPSKYGDDLSEIRESVKIVNKEKRSISGFETGRIVSGFRNVFPLNFNNEYLGSVEISTSIKTMISSITQQNKEREYLFLLNKDMALSKLLDSQQHLYKTSNISSEYLEEENNSSLFHSPKKLSTTAESINKKISNNKELKEAMKKENAWGMFANVDNTIYDVTFLPIYGVSKKIEAYLIEYKKSKNIPIFINMEIYVYLLVLLLVGLLLSLVKIINEKSKSIDNQKEWFKSITDNLGEGLYVVNLNAEITYINPIACEILGYDAKDVIGKNAHTLFHSHSFNDNIGYEKCPIYLSVRGKGFFSSRSEYFITSDGRKIPVLVNSKLIKRDNNLSELVTSFSDISIQTELEKESTLLRKALEASINCVVITNKDGNVQWANKAFESLTGFKKEEILGKNPKEFISSHKQSHEFYEEMWKTILSKKAWKGELINKKKDGSFYDEELIITPVLNEENEIVNFIAIKQDITHKKIVLQEKEEREKLLYQQSKMAAMGEMLGNIAHQWRQPLSLISTISTGIKLQKEMNVLVEDDLIKNMDAINHSSQYLSETIEDFRAFFDPKKNKESKFLISDAINKTLKLISSQFAAKEIEIIQNVKDCNIISLENELIQVLVNIFNNSRDVLIKLEDKRRLIFINIDEKDNDLIIEIKDNGKGIDKNIIDRIFEPYFTTKHKSKGTGIGLYMSSEIIKKHLNGTITVKNETYDYEGIEYTGAKFIIKIAIN